MKWSLPVGTRISQKTQISRRTSVQTTKNQKILLLDTNQLLFTVIFYSYYVKESEIENGSRVVLQVAIIRSASNTL